MMEQNYTEINNSQTPSKLDETHAFTDSKELTEL